MIKKKITGSILRHGAGYLGGAVVGFAFAKGVSINSLEDILMNIEAVLGLLSIFVVTGLSTIEKIEKQKQIEALQAAKLKKKRKVNA